MSMLTLAAFKPAFDSSMLRLGRTEMVTKEVVRSVSRDLLNAFHFGDPNGLAGDVQFINVFCGKLSPVNKRAARVFFTELAGIHFDEKQGLFTKKSKKRYEEARKKAARFLQDPHFSLWTWQRDNLSIDKAPRPVADKVASYIKGALKDGSQEDVLRGVFAGGVSILAVEKVLAEMVKAQAEAEAMGAKVQAELAAGKAEPAPAPF